ncbi:MAG: HNH endonuclease [Reichenbachiella sp.]
MGDKVLVLNLDYSPLTICTVNRAFILVYLEKADLLEKDSECSLRSVNTVYDKPAVIRIKSYINVPYRGVVLTRQNIFKRDEHHCQYCGQANELTLDHLIPKSKGGRSTWNNLVTACQSCNSKKGDLSLAKSGMILKRIPFRPSYLMFIKYSMGELRKEWNPYLRTSAVA